MNGGAYGGEIKDVLVAAAACDRRGDVRDFSVADMGFTYRHSAAPEDVIFTRRCSRERRAIPPRSWPR